LDRRGADIALLLTMKGIVNLPALRPVQPATAIVTPGRRRAGGNCVPKRHATAISYSRLVAVRHSLLAQTYAWNDIKEDRALGLVVDRKV